MIAGAGPAPVCWIDALFEIERSINDQSAEQHRAVRQELSAPLVADLERWMREQRAKLSRGNEVAKAMEYMLKSWTARPPPKRATSRPFRGPRDQCRSAGV